MKAIAVLPVKRFAAAKQRLAAGMDDEWRSALVAAMLSDVLEAIGEARAVERTIVVSNEPRAVEAATTVGAEIVTDPEESNETQEDRHGQSAPSDALASGRTPGESRGHSAAALAGVARAEELGATCVVLLPGDCPLLDSRELDHLLTGVPDSYVAIVPDRHGTGTNALVLAPPRAIQPAFGEGSCARHVAAAREAGVPYAVEEVPSLALDLDTPADIIALTRALESGPKRARRTAKALGI